MHRTNQTLSTAINELRCIRPDSAATLTELRALSLARANIDELIGLCVDELRTSAPTATWSELADALGEASPDAARVRFDRSSRPRQSHVGAFWRAISADFVRDFLPFDFLHELYGWWLRAKALEIASLERKAFIAQLRHLLSAPSGWEYRRARPGMLLAAHEPLANRIPHWSPPESNAPIHGLRRTATATPHAPGD